MYLADEEISAVARAGCDVTVLEAAAELGEVGQCKLAYDAVHS
jgi:hypothetical protein